LSSWSKFHLSVSRGHPLVPYSVGARFIVGTPDTCSISGKIETALKCDDNNIRTYILYKYTYRVPLKCNVRMWWETKRFSVSFENINLKNNNNTVHVISSTTELYNPLYTLYSFIVYALNRFDFRSARLYDFGVVIYIYFLIPRTICPFMIVINDNWYCGTRSLQFILYRYIHRLPVFCQKNIPRATVTLFWSGSRVYLCNNNYCHDRTGSRYNIDRHNILLGK
jgi:hypothetical protein